MSMAIDGLLERVSFPRVGTSVLPLSRSSLYAKPFRSGLHHHAIKLLQPSLLNGLISGTADGPQLLLENSALFISVLLVL